MATPHEDLVQELAAHPDRVLVLAGAGVAMASDRNPCGSWVGLIENGIERCRERCLTLPPKWYEVIKGLVELKRTEDLIDAASRIKSELAKVHDGEFARWLSESVGKLTLTDDQVVRGLLELGVRIATTNYDNLFEEASGLSPVTWTQGDLAIGVLRGDAPGILHLHGHYALPESVVFSSKSYEDICRDERAQNFLRSVFTLGTVVFVGCGAGVEDPNFAGLFEWSREALRGGRHTHYHLVLEKDVVATARQYQGLKVTPLAYGSAHADLASFLGRLAERARQARTAPNPLDVLRTGQSAYESQLRSLREGTTALPPVDLVRQAFSIARALWDVGGRRVAAQHMYGILSSAGDGLPPAERVQYTLEAVERLLEDGTEFFAGRLMEQLSADIGAMPPDAATLERFRRLQARCLSAEAHLDDLLRVIRERLPLAGADERNRLTADLAELQFLLGSLPEAERTILGGDR